MRFLICRKMCIRALRPEKFCAWKAAIRKALGFCFSELHMSERTHVPWRCQCLHVFSGRKKLRLALMTEVSTNHDNDG